MIHAVGPIFYKNPKDAPTLLKSAYLNTLNLAAKNFIKSIAFPCISTGIYGYPKAEAATIAVSTAKEFLKTNEMRIIFCCFEDEDFEKYQKLMKN